MSIIQSLFLSLIQGLTEFLPISSSGHLILIPHFFKWEDQGLAFDAIIHIGTAAAAIIYFRREIWRILRGFFSNDKKSRRLGYVIVIASVPAALAGFLLRSFIAGQARVLPVVALNLFIWGIFLILAEYYADKHGQKISLFDIGYIRGFLIGMAQALALIPGTSRSGITISAGFFTDLKREDAVRFSFLMSIPVILGAGLLSFIDLFTSQGMAFEWLPVILALLGSFASGLLAIYILIKFINKGGLVYFGIYRILLSIILFFTIL